MNDHDTLVAAVVSLVRGDDNWASSEFQKEDDVIEAPMKLENSDEVGTEVDPIVDGIAISTSTTFTGLLSNMKIKGYHACKLNLESGDMEPAKKEQWSA